MHIWLNIVLQIRGNLLKNAGHEYFNMNIHFAWHRGEGILIAKCRDALKFRHNVVRYKEEICLFFICKF